MLTCAVSDIEIGIDIEKIGKTKFDVAKRFFSPDEYESLLNGESFYDIWTKKESCCKKQQLF